MRPVYLRTWRGLAWELWRLPLGIGRSRPT
jgi:hypothetical protein